MTAAIGVIVGLGSLGIALLITALALIILSLARLEHTLEGDRHVDRESDHER
jgi:uncharacterized membrane protein YhiD involved in acid resistance